ncbi:MAG: serine/threonine protein kinase, partial [Gemmataceae bacterium]|nr:serine/threonine protein kinase [Gemmataceae bacterium]
MNKNQVKLSWPSLDEPVAAGSEPAATPAAPLEGAETAAFTAGETVKSRLAAAGNARTFGRYEIQGVLGKGGMGEVYLAYDTVLLRTVALKAPRLAEDAPVQRERFLREARAAAALHHPNICPLHDVGEADGQVFLTMAHIDGAPLSTVIRTQGAMDPDRAVTLIHKVALAMHHAHERGLLHRDLKPGNILLTKSGEPSVTDFGLAFRFDADTSNRLTETGLVVGTPTYMPPEQVNGQALGPTADVYSLGVVMYELLAGKPPFAGTLGKVIAQIESAPPPPLCQLQPSIDPALEAICSKALAKLPAERYPDMAAFAQALDQYAEEKRARLLAEEATRAMRRRVRWLVGTAVLAVAATVTAAVLLVRRPDRDIAAVPEMHLTDAERLFDALAKPLVKIECAVAEDMPLSLGRHFVPASLLQVQSGGGNWRFHDGPLYFSVTGNGTGHVLDLSDQPGQAGQITFFGGEIDVKAPYLLFLGNLTPSSRIYIKGGIGYSILAPMDGGPGSKHVQFDGTHFLMPKIRDPKIDTTEATGAD